MDPLSSAASVIAVIALADRVLVAVGRYLRAVKDSEGDIKRLHEEIASVTAILRTVPTDSKLKVLEDAVQECFSELRNISTVLGPEEPNQRSRKRLKFSMDALTWPFKRKEVDQIVQSLDRKINRLSPALQAENREHNQQNERRMLISSLKVTETAAFNSKIHKEKSVCLGATRKELLDDISNWMDDPDGAVRYWLRGMAGTGKSTIARTIAETSSKNKRLAASFFFQRGSGDLASSASLVPTIAKQLARNIPDLELYICESIRQKEDINSRSLVEQWERLVQVPIMQLNRNLALNPVDKMQSLFLSGGQPYIVIIDALDECDTTSGGAQKDDEYKRIISSFSTLDRTSSVQLRVFLTSRPEMTIADSFKSISDPASYSVFTLHRDIEDYVVELDILNFIEAQLSKVYERYADELEDGWPGAEAIDALAKHADKLFIYASTVCKFIGDSHFMPDERLEEVLESPAGISISYIPIYSSALY